MSGRGFTIIELLIVVVLVFLIVSGVAVGLGSTKTARLQSAGWLLVSASKHAYSRAVSKGSTVRIVIDFEERTIQLQETYGRVVLNRDDETGVGLNRKDSMDEYLPDGTVIEADLSGKLKRIGPTITGESLSDGTSITIVDPFLQGLQAQGGGLPRYVGPRFEEIEGNRGQKRQLKEDIGFLKVYTPHAPHPIEQGFAFIYYFPGGLTERTFIQIGDLTSPDSDVRTIAIHPLNGRAEIFYEALSPSYDLDDFMEVRR